MFKSIAKTLTALGLITTVVVSLMWPSLAAAQGEHYYFQDNTYTTIVGTGGAFKNDTTFTPTGGNGFHGQLGYSCGNQPYNLDLNLTLIGAVPPTVFPVAGNLNYNSSVG